MLITLTSFVPDSFLILWSFVLSTMWPTWVTEATLEAPFSWMRTSLRGTVVKCLFSHTLLASGMSMLSHFLSCFCSVMMPWCRRSCLTHRSRISLTRGRLSGPTRSVKTSTTRLKRLTEWIGIDPSPSRIFIVLKAWMFDYVKLTTWFMLQRSPTTSTSTSNLMSDYVPCFSFVIDIKF